MNNLYMRQLQSLFYQSCILECLSYRNRYRFSGEKAFLHYIVFNRLGKTKLKLSQTHFGGYPIRFNYSIRLVGIYLYDFFNHKVSGNSMRMWMNKSEDSRHAIWDKSRNGAKLEEFFFDG